MDGGTRVSVSQFKHQLLLLLGELLVEPHLPLQRHLHVLLLPGQLPGNIQQEEIREVYLQLLADLLFMTGGFIGGLLKSEEVK